MKKETKQQNTEHSKQHHKSINYKMDVDNLADSSVDKTFLKSKFVYNENKSMVAKKRLLQEVKMDVMTFHNIRTRAKSLHQQGKFIEAIAEYTKTIEILTKIIHVEAGRAAEEEILEEEEIRRKEEERLKWEKYENEKQQKKLRLTNRRKVKKDNNNINNDKKNGNDIKNEGESDSLPEQQQHSSPIDNEQQDDDCDDNNNNNNIEESPISPRKLAERKKFRAYKLSKHLQQIVPTEQVVRIYLGRASCFSKLSDHRRSIEDANSALSLDPSNIKAYVRRGESLMQLQQFREASDTYRDGLKIDPSHRSLKKGFQDSLRGLRVQWHQYFPTYGHTSASTEIAGDPTDAPSGVNRLLESFINPTEAHQDVEIKEVCAQSGMHFDILDLLKQEAQWWTTNAMRYAEAVAQSRDFDSARVQVIRALIKHKNDMLLLFTKYCEADYDERLTRSYRLSSFVTQGMDGGDNHVYANNNNNNNNNNKGNLQHTPKPPISKTKNNLNNNKSSRHGNNLAPAAIHHHRPPYTPKSERLTLSYEMCKRMFLDFGLITPSFGKTILENAWKQANSNLLNVPKTPLVNRPSNPKTLVIRKEQKLMPLPTSNDTNNNKNATQKKQSQKKNNSNNNNEDDSLTNMALGFTLLFPKFLEVVVRVSYARYKPITSDGIKPPTFVERLENALNKHFIPSAIAIRAASEAGTSQPSLVTAETDSAWINENVLEVMEIYKPRLGKVFDYFSQKDRASKKMDLVEFLYVLKSLGLVDVQRATLHAGCKIFVSICGYIGAIDVDKIDLDDFVEALARFGDIRTHDGMVSLPKRLNAFFSNVVLQKARHRTDIAALWL